jgi:hypothetical protein
MRYILDNMTAVELEMAKIRINWGNRKMLPETDQEIVIAEGVDLEAEPEQ